MKNNLLFEKLSGFLGRFQNIDQYRTLNEYF